MKITLRRNINDPDMVDVLTQWRTTPLSRKPRYQVWTTVPVDMLAELGLNWQSFDGDGPETIDIVLDLTMP